MKILVIGITGMLGNVVFRTLSSSSSKYSVIGTTRSSHIYGFFDGDISKNIIDGIDVENYDLLVKVFDIVRPQLVINCVGLVKQLVAANDPLLAIPLNALLPHRLASLCSLVGARLIHISTDCVFSGSKGNYLESDIPDAKDLYGRSKLLGEVSDCRHAVTLRTSIIGHELSSNRSLIDWFLSQEGSVKGFSQAIFSGLPTVELARVIRDYVIPSPNLHGLYHVAAEPIDKYSLLKLVSEVYKKEIQIVEDSSFTINRSLNANKFNQITGYVAPAWHDLVSKMHASR